MSLRPLAILAFAVVLGCGAQSTGVADLDGGPPSSLDDAGCVHDDVADCAGTCGAQTSRCGGPLDCGPCDGGSCVVDCEGVVLFGGFDRAASMSEGDTWLWDGAAWTMSSAPGPSPRSQHAMATLNATATLFGGVSGSTALGDMWTWSGASWSQNNASGPSARYGHVMAGGADSLVLFGGLQPGDAGALAVTDETWVWNGSAWEQDTPYGPGARQAAALTVRTSGVATLFGGAGPNGGTPTGTWSFDGLTWTAPNVMSPTPRTGHAMASANGVTVLFGGMQLGGTAVFGDTWIWDGIAWAQQKVSGPSARTGHAMATLNGSVVLFGGEDASGADLADTWIWNGTSWIEANVPGPSARERHAMAAW